MLVLSLPIVNKDFQIFETTLLSEPVQAWIGSPVPSIDFELGMIGAWHQFVVNLQASCCQQFVLNIEKYVN